MPKWVRAEDFQQKAFTGWLLDQGGTSLEKRKGEYELIRYRRGADIFLVYTKPSKGRVTFSIASWDHYQQFLAGGTIADPEPVSTGKRKSVRLYTDAGLRDATGSGSWAGVLVVPGSTIECSGALRGEISSSTAAEMMAVANSIHSLLLDGHIAREFSVLVYCDNMNVVHRLQRWPGKIKKAPEQIEVALKTIYELARKYDLHIRSRWVKGHQKNGSEDYHSKFNKRADYLCNKHGRKLHKERVKNGV